MKFLRKKPQIKKIPKAIKKEHNEINFVDYEYRCKVI